MRMLWVAVLLSFAGCATPRPPEELKAINRDAFQTVSFASLDGTTLQGYLFKPEGAGPFPAVLALHGCAGLFSENGKMHSRDLDWGRRLSAEGYAVLYPDSFATRGVTEICTARHRFITPEHTRPRDAYGALAWFEAQPYVATDRVALMGWSNGGSTLLWTIGARAAFLAKGIAHDFRTAIAFYPGCLSVSHSHDWTNRIPLQIFIGENDNWTEAKYCTKIVEASTETGALKPQLRLYSGSYHDFDAPHTPLTERHGLTTASTGASTALYGTNEPAREDAIARVREILAKALAP